MAPPPPPGLIDDLIGEILLRLPPEDPEHFFRASLVCKPWRRLLSDPGFQRCYREFHGSPPLLGFLHTTAKFHTKKDGYRLSLFPQFIPIKEPSRILHPRQVPDCKILDCRHGRVLLFKHRTGLIIWDPITGARQHIGQPEFKDCLYRLTAAVLCTVVGCDHLGCRRGGPSLVVFVEIDIPIRHQNRASASASVYSSETGAWNNAGVSSVEFDLVRFASRKALGSSLLAGDALYFILEEGRRILKYDLAGCGLSVMSPPPLPVGNMVLMKAEGGGLGAVGVEGYSLHLWAWQTGPGGIWEWQKGRVIQLDIGLLSTKPYVVDFAEGAGSIFVRTYNGVFTVELKSGRARKIEKAGNFEDIFPFMSFYTPETMLPPDGQSANDDGVTNQVT